MSEAKRKNLSVVFFLILSILLFVLANGAVVFFETPLRFLESQDLFVWKTKLAVLKKLAPGSVRIAFLGDSQTMSGILPGQLSKKGDVWNLALPSMQPEGIESLFLDPLIALSPETVVFNTGPYALFQTDNFGAFTNYFRRIAPLEAWSFQAGGFFYREGFVTGNIPLSVLNLLPLYRLGRTTSDLLQPYDAIDGIAPVYMEAHAKIAGSELHFQRLVSGETPLQKIKARKERNEQILEILHDNRGFWSWNSLEKPENAGCESSTRPVELPVVPIFKRRPGAVESWIRILKKIERAGIRPIVIRIPFSRRWGELASTPELVKQTDEIFNLLETSVTGLTTIRVPDDLFIEENGDFLDITHLSACGAKKMTLWLVKNYPEIFSK